MPGGKPFRKLVAIRESDGVHFRWVSAGYKKPTAIKRWNTKWASCEIGRKTEPTPPRMVAVGITSAGHTVFGESMTRPLFNHFNDPCPLGKPPKKAKEKKNV